MYVWVMFQKEVANMFTLSHFESWSFYLDFFEVHVQACYTWTMETRCLRTWTSHALCKRRMLGISKARLTMSAWFQCAIIYADPTSLCSLIGLIYLKHICIFIIDASGFRLAWSSEFWQSFDLGHATKPEDTEPTVSRISKISGRGQVLYVNSRNPACAPSHNIRRCRSRDAHKHRLRAESTFSLSIVQVLTWWEIESPPACTKKHWNSTEILQQVLISWGCVQETGFVITSSVELLAFSCPLPGWLFSRMRTAQGWSIPTTRRQI